MRFYDFLIDANKVLAGERDSRKTWADSASGTVNVITRNSASDRFPIRYGLRASDFSFVSIQGTVSVISDGVTLNCRLINSFY